MLGLTYAHVPKPHFNICYNAHVQSTTTTAEKSTKPRTISIQMRSFASYPHCWIPTSSKFIQVKDDFLQWPLQAVLGSLRTERGLEELNALLADRSLGRVWKN